MLNCSLDARVADFIRRDAIHLGISGYSFELEDLLGQMTVLNGRLALREDGISIGEQIIAARYWLFKRIYWNTPNRALMCMVRYALYLLGRNHNGFVKALRNSLYDLTEEETLKFCRMWASNEQETAVVDILDKLCSQEQALFGAVLQFSEKETPRFSAACKRISQMNFEEMLAFADRLERKASSVSPRLQSGGTRRVLLLDMAPDEKHGGNKLGEDIQVVRRNGTPLGALSDESEIVKGVTASFRGYLRRGRIFCNPDVLRDLNDDERSALIVKLEDGLNELG